MVGWWSCSVVMWWGMIWCCCVVVVCCGDVVVYWCDGLMVRLCRAVVYVGGRFKIFIRLYELHGTLD